MKKIGLVLFSAWVCFCSFTAMAAKEITLHVNASALEFQIVLPANRTTGYVWTLEKYNKKRFHLKESHYRAPNSKLMGAGGEMVYVFQLKKEQSNPKKTYVKLKYAQPWKKSSAIVTMVTVIFDSE